MNEIALFGLAAFRWVLLLIVLMTAIVLVEAWIGHYRSDFPLRAQYAPFVVGGLLILAAFAFGVAPASSIARGALRWVGWLTVITGVVGAAYHHYYGIVEKAGGYRLLLHYLMYGAPQLAPLALSALGAVAVVLTSSDGDSDVPARALLIITGVALGGAVMQAGILHFRGAFNSPLMYAPVTLPMLAILLAIWTAVRPDRGLAVIAQLSFLATFLMGFVGLGMHLRGVERQMGGAYLFRINLLQGPPPLAPAMFSGLAALGMIASRSL